MQVSEDFKIIYFYGFKFSYIFIFIFLALFSPDVVTATIFFDGFFSSTNLLSLFRCPPLNASFLIEWIS